MAVSHLMRLGDDRHDDGKCGAEVFRRGYPRVVARLDATERKTVKGK